MLRIHRTEVSGARRAVAAAAAAAAHACIDRRRCSTVDMHAHRVACSRRSFAGDTGVRVDLIWQILYIVLAILIALIIPFAFFFYGQPAYACTHAFVGILLLLTFLPSSLAMHAAHSTMADVGQGSFLMLLVACVWLAETENDMDDEVETESFFDTQAGGAIKYTLLVAVVFCVVLGIMYAFLNKANIPVVRYAQSLEFQSDLLGVAELSGADTTVCDVTKLGIAGPVRSNRCRGKRQAGERRDNAAMLRASMRSCHSRALCVSVPC
jgi:hypothetical protein